MRVNVLFGDHGHLEQNRTTPLLKKIKPVQTKSMAKVTFDVGDEQVRSTLAGAHRDRHAAGRQQTRDTKAKAASLRESGQTARADLLEEISVRRTHSSIRRAQLRDEKEAQRRWGRIRAKVVEPPRVSGKLRRARYNREDFGTGGIGEPVRSGARDLYVQFIPRGLNSGSVRNYKDGKPKPAGNRASWKPGETGDKIQYICRDEALEDVPGAIVSNMGSSLSERVACGLAVERVEELGRADAGVYRHVIIALPHELEPEQRVALLNRLVKPIGDLKLPFTASLHKPDKDGDERNYHMHIVVCLRPFGRKGPLEWEFGVSKLTWVETPTAHRLIRRHLAREFNRALRNAGQETRWTYLSRAARGERSPGNTKRHRSDIRGDRAIESAEQDQRVARMHLELVAAVQSCIEALPGDADREPAAAASRSAFLGRVVTLLETWDAEPPARNRRQAGERLTAFNEKVAGEVAAEALRARARGTAAGEKLPLQMPTLAPLLNHFGDSKQVKAALAFQLSVKAAAVVPPGPTATGRISPDVPVPPDLAVPTAPAASAIEPASSVAAHDSAILNRRSVSAAADHQGRELPQGTSEPVLGEASEPVTVPDDGEQLVSRSLTTTDISRGRRHDRRTGTQRRWQRANDTSPRRGYPSGSAGRVAAAARSSVPEMSGSGILEGAIDRDGGGENWLLLPLLRKGHVESEELDDTEVRRMGIVAGLMKPGTGIVESLVPTIEGFDALGLPTRSLFEMDQELAVLGGVTTVQGTPERVQAAEIAPPPVVGPLFENDQPHERTGFAEAVSNLVDSSLVANNPVAPQTAIALLLNPVDPFNTIEGGRVNEASLAAGEVPVEAQAGALKAPASREPLEPVGVIEPEDLKAILGRFQKHGSKCMRRVKGKMEFDKSLFEDFPRSTLQAAWQSPLVKKAFLKVTKAAEAEEDDLLQGIPSSRGRDI